MPASRPIQWPRMGPRLRVAGSILAAIGLGSCNIRIEHQPFPALIGAILMVIGGMLAVLGEMFSPARQREGDEDPKGETETKAPILFLRPFDADNPQFGYRMYRYIFGYGGYFQNVYTP